MDTFILMMMKLKYVDVVIMDVLSSMAQQRVLLDLQIDVLHRMMRHLY